MQEIIPNTKDRILYLAEIQEDSKQTFFKKIGSSYGNFTGKSKNSEPNNNVIKEILLNYPSVNPMWLVTGQGDILLNNINDSSKTITIGENIPKGAIPFYNLPVSAGHSLFEIEGAMKPDGYVMDLPGVGYTEAFLPVRGYSMYPEVKEGAIIGVKTADRWDYLNTQHKYLIITREDRMIKYIEHDKTNPDILKCISPNYGDFEILKEDIMNVYRVTFVMNPE